MKLIELSSHDYLIINAGTLFTGASLKVKKNVRIHIWDGRVQYIEEEQEMPSFDKKPSSTGEGRMPAGGAKYREIGGAGLTVLPGLIDCHVHLALDGGNTHQGQLRENPLKLKERLQDRLFSDLSHGIVAVRDGGDRDGIGLACRNRIHKEELAGPIIMASGKALHKDGGYGSFLGDGVACGELSKALQKCIREGINQVKVLVSGIVSFTEYGRVGRIQFDLKELEYMVRMAGDHGLKVMAHASSDEAVRLCIKAGVHSIEHGYFISEESLRAMAERKIAWVPTVIPVAVQNRRKPDGSYTVDKGVVERTYRRQLRMIRRAQQLGVILGVGTDAGATGVRHGAGFYRELQLYREAGLTAEEVLMAATRNGAYIIGMDGRLGVIAPGMPAFLTAIDGDPLHDMEKLSDIKYLIRPVQGTVSESACRPA